MCSSTRAIVCRTMEVARAARAIDRVGVRRAACASRDAANPTGPAPPRRSAGLDARRCTGAGRRVGRAARVLHGRLARANARAAPGWTAPVYPWS